PGRRSFGSLISGVCWWRRVRFAYLDIPRCDCWFVA
ncbi:uncharacterized protein METZ01_LOCUS432298, partial [marine metagenome]